MLLERQAAKPRPDNTSGKAERCLIVVSERVGDRRCRLSINARGNDFHIGWIEVEQGFSRMVRKIVLGILF